MDCRQRGTLKSFKNQNKFIDKCNDAYSGWSCRIRTVLTDRHDDEFGPYDMVDMVLLADSDNFNLGMFYFFSLRKNSFLPDILTDAKSINAAPTIDSHSAFYRF